jgi:hypothetical protein
MSSSQALLKAYISEGLRRDEMQLPWTSFVDEVGLTKEGRISSQSDNPFEQ